MIFQCRRICPVEAAEEAGFVIDEYKFVMHQRAPVQRISLVVLVAAPLANLNSGLDKFRYLVFFARKSASIADDSDDCAEFVFLD